MIQLPLERTPAWYRVLRAGAIFLSIAFHGALAWMAMQDTPEKAQKDNWVEMTVVERKPPPPPPPPPEQPKPKPPPKAVDFSKTVKEPPKDQPPEAQPEKRVVRRIQGLSASSFAAGSGTGIDARAGTTLGTRAGSDTMSLDQAKNAVSYAAATVQPRLRYKPPLEVPEAVKTNNVEGTVEVLLDLDVSGKVVKVTLAPGRAALGSGAEEACLAAWRQARYSPAMQGDAAVPVTNVPQRCTFKALE